MLVITITLMINPLDGEIFWVVINLISLCHMII